MHSNEGVNLGQGVHSNEGVNLGQGVHSNEGVNLGQECSPTKESTWDKECTPMKESTWDRIVLQRRSQLGTMGPKLTPLLDSLPDPFTNRKVQSFGCIFETCQ